MDNDDGLLDHRYRLESALSQGGHSTTWAAFDTERSARCVVKELSVGAVVRDGSGAASFDGDDFTKVIDLFEREARVLEHLDHPRVPGFVDHFRVETDSDTRLYTVQDFVEGETLEALVAGGRHFTEDEAVAVADELLSILDYLHDRSPPLIHRDIKPANVIVAPDGAVHLVDFGSVRTAVDGSGLDGKTIVGTYGYMPMEQYEARAVPQSDLYALGMTLVFMLSHRSPTEITRTGLTLDFRPFVHVSDQLADVIEWMIEAAPGDRPENAAVVRDALRAEGVPERAAAPVDVPRALSRHQYPPKAVMALSAGLGGLLILLLAVSLLFRGGGVGLAPGAAVPTADTPAPEMNDGGRRVVEPPAGRPGSVEPVDGVLTISLYEDFRYVEEGWPMGRSVSQTFLPALSTTPPSGLRLPSSTDGLIFGHVPLGNDDDHRIDFALAEADGVWSIFLDRDNDEDLSNDGPAIPNQGSGNVFAAFASVRTNLRLDDGERLERPYSLWIWFAEDDASVLPVGRFYARHHYRGVLRLGGSSYEAVAFEFNSHDALLREAGICIDFDGDEECADDREVFHDGDMIRLGHAPPIRLRLAYP